MNAIPVTTGSVQVRKIKRPAEYLSVEESAPETALRRLKASVAEQCSAQRGTQYGLLRLRGDLTDAQFSACQWFGELHAAYLLAMDARQLRSGSAEMVAKSEPLDPYSEAGQRAAKRERAIFREYEAAELAGLACGHGAWLMFRDVVLDDTVPTWIGRAAVVKVSEALREFRARDSRFRRGKR